MNKFKISFKKDKIDDSLLSSEAEQMLPTMMNNPFFQNMMKSDMFQNLDANVDKAEEKNNLFYNI